LQGGFYLLAIFGIPGSVRK